MLACGLDGIENNFTHPDPIEESLYQMTEKEKSSKNIETLPESLAEALAELKNDYTLTSLLGKHVLNSLASAANKDIASARQEVTPWEIKRYL